MTLRDDAGLNLTPKQLKFVEAYIETRGNAPEAALQAYNCSSRNSMSEEVLATWSCNRKALS